MANKKYTKKEILEFYNNFLSKIPERLEKIKILLNKDIVDYTYLEIDKVGKLYKEYVKNNSISGDWNEEIFEIFLTYCGEAWIFYFGGKWEECLDKRSTTFGFPVIVEWGPKKYPWISVNPLDWARLIEEGDNEPLSLPWKRNVDYFISSPEWNFNPIKAK